MTLHPEELCLLPMGMKRQLGEAIGFNQLILQYINKYPSPIGMNADMASSIRHKLDTLRKLNHQITMMCSGWLDHGEG